MVRKKDFIQEKYEMTMENSSCRSSVGLMRSLENCEKRREKLRCDLIIARQRISAAEGSLRVLLSESEGVSQGQNHPSWDSPEGQGQSGPAEAP